jgi:hypothetical protein
LADGGNKIPYSNTGQGVFTIVNREELNAFMQLRPLSTINSLLKDLIKLYVEFRGNTEGSFYHTSGRYQDTRAKLLWQDYSPHMVSSSSIKPLHACPQALSPLPDNLEGSQSSWEILSWGIHKKGENL